MGPGLLPRAELPLRPACSTNPHRSSSLATHTEVTAVTLETGVPQLLPMRLIGSSQSHSYATEPLSSAVECVRAPPLATLMYCMLLQPAHCLQTLQLPVCVFVAAAAAAPHGIITHTHTQRDTDRKSVV